MKQFKETITNIFLNAGSETRFFESASGLLNESIGFKLHTLTLFHPDQKFIRRIYSSNNDIYPVGGDKPVPDNYWAELTIRKQQSFIGNNRTEIEKYFFDHQTITNLGCESILNQVVLFNGSTIGTINLLNTEGYFQPEHLQKTDLFAKFAAPFFLSNLIQLISPQS